MTGWVILRHEEANLWRQITAIVADGPLAAVHQATDEGPYQGGKFIAIANEDWARQFDICESDLERAARELVDAVRAHDPELVSNDLGNALDAVEDALQASAGRSSGEAVSPDGERGA